MKTKPIIRIVIWSLVLVLLVGILVIGIQFRSFLNRGQTLIQAEPVKADIPVPRTESHNSPSGIVATVTATAVNVRSAPNSDSSTVGMLEENDTVTIGRQEQVNAELWAYITSPCSGWVKAEYLNMASAPSGPAQNPFSLDPSQISEIKIEWAAGSISLETADVDTIQITESCRAEVKHPMVIKQSGHELTIRFSENTKLEFGFGNRQGDAASKDLVILVPMDWECNSLEIDAASAAVDVTNMVIRELDFDGASGTCNFANCVVGELDLDTASGNIFFTGSLDFLDCDAASACVTAVFDNIPGMIDMDSVSGDLDVTLPVDAGFTVSLDALSNKFHCDFDYTVQNGNYCHGDGGCRITMDAMSGDLYIRKPAETGSSDDAA